MASHGVFSIVAVVLAVATVAILIATKRIRSGWMPWITIPIVAFVWYWLIVCIYLAYYTWRLAGVK